MAHLPQPTGRYYEPFVGGGAVFFKLQPSRATLSDANPELIELYQVIRDRVEELIALLALHTNSSEHFYRVRAQNTATLTPLQRAARTIFLNKTCYNGLYRVNSRGLFNVPYGRYVHPRICDAENLRLVAASLRRVTLRQASAFDVGRSVRRGDLVYFDPPYDSLNPRGAFTQYHRSPFGREQQVALRDLFLALAQRGVQVVLSNADTPFIRTIYQSCSLTAVLARRAINSQSTQRGPVGELIITPPRL
jgi:DNA adenine methylase